MRIILCVKCILLIGTEYGTCVDMWSLGCVISEMVDQKRLFDARNASAVCVKIVEVKNGDVILFKLILFKFFLFIKNVEFILKNLNSKETQLGENRSR